MTDVPVSQEAREVVADYGVFRLLPGLVAEGIRAGRNDGNDLVQAFAKFEQSIRQQAERDVIARMEVVGWLYKKQGEEPQVTTIRWRDIVDGKFVFGSGDWTETPLYAHPQPSADLVEQIAELQLAAFIAGRGSIVMKADGRTRQSKPGPTMDDYRNMARAALAKAGEA